MRRNALNEWQFPSNAMSAAPLVEPGGTRQRGTERAASLPAAVDATIQSWTQPLTPARRLTTSPCSTGSSGSIRKDAWPSWNRGWRSSTVCSEMTAPSFRRILEVLEQHGVEYVVVGGVAAVLQGAPVTTFDIDALIKVDSANIDRLAQVLAILDARYREHRDLRPTPSDLSAGGHLLLATNGGPLDLLGFIGGGKRYEDVADSARRISVGDLTIRVLSIEALIADKQALGRDKDLVVVRILEAILNRQRGS
ncbi:MAG: hypothetical protein EPO25_14620 [Gammaproteobacteria bacterium]|nr:MAG: hypothetical protein EPO25_14620 [Gammaproteobacteria bacterium]